MNTKNLLVIGSMLILASISGVAALSGEQRWHTPDFSDGSRLDYVWGFTCYGEGQAGDRVSNDVVNFDKRDIVDFSVFLTGFNMWYTQDGDHAQMRNRIDVWKNGITDMHDPDAAGENPPNKYGQTANIKFTYALVDVDPSGNNDKNTACVAVCVVALTKPCKNCKG